MRRAIRLLVAMPVALAFAADRGGSQPPAEQPSPRALTDPQDDYPIFSPDGRRIVFQSNRTGTWHLWIMNADGSCLRQLTHGSANDRTPSWSADGSKILFSSDRALVDEPSRATDRRPERRHIFVLNLASSGGPEPTRIERLLESPEQDIHPTWARDGRSIVFNRAYRLGERNVADVMMMDSDGRNPRRVPLPVGMNTFASLTPDGARLVYRGTTIETRDGREVENSDIWSAAPDGSDPRRLTDDPEFDGWPAISPDGRTIAFASRRGGGRFQLYLMPIAGGEPRRLTLSETMNHTQPAWAPDSRRLLAYRWVREGGSEIGQIVSLDLEGDAAPPPAADGTCS